MASTQNITRQAAKRFRVSETICGIPVTDDEFETDDIEEAVDIICNRLDDLADQDDLALECSKLSPEQKQTIRDLMPSYENACCEAIKQMDLEEDIDVTVGQRRWRVLVI